MRIESVRLLLCDSTTSAACVARVPIAQHSRQASRRSQAEERGQASFSPSITHTNLSRQCTGATGMPLFSMVHLQTLCRTRRLTFMLRTHSRTPLCTWPLAEASATSWRHCSAGQPCESRNSACGTASDGAGRRAPPEALWLGEYQYALTATVHTLIDQYA